MSNKLKCIVCGKLYEACPRCTELQKKGMFAWRQLYDTPECFQLSTIVYDHSRGSLTDADALAMLSRFDLDQVLPDDSDVKQYLQRLLFMAPQPVAEAIELELVEAKIPKSSSKKKIEEIIEA